MSVTSGGFSDSSAGGGFPDAFAGDAGEMLVQALKSPNFVHLLRGWQIQRNGNAEFNNLTLRGTFFGTNFIISNLGAFFYSGTPALGNLVQSITSVAGTDSVGNAYLAGTTTYTNIGGTFFAVNQWQNRQAFYTAAAAAGPYSEGAAMRLSGTAVLIDVFAPVTHLQLPNVQANGAIPNMVGGQFWSIDSWTTVAAGFGGGWTGTLSYMMTPDGFVALDVHLTPGGTVADGTAIFTLPIAYAPMTAKQCAMSSDGGLKAIGGGEFPHLYITNGGVIQCFGATAAGSYFRGSGQYALGV